jgi:hypothetical protein
VRILVVRQCTVKYSRVFYICQTEIFAL